jgi:hypothetical protein
MDSRFRGNDGEGAAPDIIVTPAKAGVHATLAVMDSRFRGNDEGGPARRPPSPPRLPTVTPAKAGVHATLAVMDSRFRGNDGEEPYAPALASGRRASSPSRL